MEKPTYDLAVAYRIYPKVSSHRPPIFADDKLKLSQLCVQSFKKSLGDLRVKMWVLLDNCPPAYEELFKQLWKPEDLVLMRFPGVGDQSTLRQQSKILTEQTDADIVYFAEDDYFYLPEEFQSALKFMREHPDVDFVTPYDHPDVHSTALHRIPTEYRQGDKRRWQRCVSTTHTFMARRNTLQQCCAVFEASYGKVSPDLAKWLALTKLYVFNPWWLASWSFTNPFWAASIYLAWRYCWRQILFGRRYTLWSPHPTVATHMVHGLESPGFDWSKEFSKS